MIGSRIQDKVKQSKADEGDYLADAIIDLCFITSYKIEELLKMPPKRLKRLLDRYKERFCGDNK